MHTISKFFLYNNLVPIIISVMIVGAGATFASTDTGQTALIGRTETVVSIDNSYLLAAQLADWSPKVTVTNVVKEGSVYVVTYTLETIDVENYVWKSLTKTQDMRVDEEVLVKYTDLAAYVQFQLKDVVVGEKDRLVRTQELQKDALTPKATVVSYTGLIGAVLTEDTVVADPYAVTPSTEGTVPVVVPTQEAVVAAAAEVPPIVQEPSSINQSPSSADSSSINNQPPSINQDPSITIQLLGTEVVTLNVGDSYTDLGALAKDAEGNGLSVARTVNGNPVAEGESVSISTTSPGVFTIVYSATKGSDTVSVTRTVSVSEAASVPAEIQTEIQTQTDSGITQTEIQTQTDSGITQTVTPTPEPTSTPETMPEPPQTTPTTETTETIETAPSETPTTEAVSQ